MAYRKFKADKLFTGKELLSGDQILITDDKGFVQEIVAESDAGEDIQQVTGLLSPGFVNCHCHLELSRLKGTIPEHTGLINFVLGVMKQRYFPEEELVEAIKAAEEEMLQNGIVAVGDICNNTLTLAQKEQNRLYYHNFIEVSGFVPKFAIQRFIQTQEEVFDDFAKVFPDNSTIVPHSPYSVSSDLFSLINACSAGDISSIHNQETRAENEFFMTGTGDFNKLYETLSIDINAFYKPTGKSSIQSYLSKISEPKQLLLVHNTFTSEEDILFVKRAAGATRYFFCLCVNANNYIEHTMPPIELLRKHHCSIVLGTDSLASNHSLSIADEMRTIVQHFPTIPLAEILQWGTLNGARALQVDHVSGSFEKGKQPGIINLQEDLTGVKRLL